MQIKSRVPLKNVYSPLAGLDILRKGDHEARATLELDSQVALLAQAPELAPCFAFSSRIVVVLGDRVIDMQ